MYKILITSALSQELKIIKKSIKKLSLKNLSFSYFSTGVGNYNMILNLTRFLEKNDFHFIVNIGVCGYKSEKLDFFQVSRIFNFANKKEILVPYIINFGSLESIFCSEVSIFSTKNMGDENFVDMESYGFEKVLDNFSIPRLILKVPVDNIGKEDFDFIKAENYLEKNLDYKDLFEKIENYLEKNKKNNPDFERIFQFYDFSFSEKEIFKKLFFSYKALTGEDFSVFFKKYQHLGKKDFLEIFRKYNNKFLIK